MLWDYLVHAHLCMNCARCDGWFIFNVRCTFSKKSEWSSGNTSTSYSRGTVFGHHVRCILIKKSEWSSGNTEGSQSGGYEFKPSWMQQSGFFLNYKLKHYVLLETNTFSGWGTQLLDSLVCRVEMQEPRVHLSRWVRAPGKLASFWHDFVYNYTVHHTI